MSESKTPKMSEEMQTEVTKRGELKHVETLEKNVLPTKQDLEDERKHQAFKNDVVKDIDGFDKNLNLRHVKATERDVLPSSYDISIEKTPQLITEFDKKGLRHVEPNVKNSVEVFDEKQ
ncbi:hypothetical protein Mgra_00005542 [Meloidogyne graminicola]|uniref:Thymosin beta n=1 Tax=Meloidogyne graminicola TaxID=189291 RepID=A0A8S9ZPA1_9BILA|nr:hypothetical protein Mgra_00005542 [Meloidogyne graminicola]